MKPIVAGDGGAAAIARATETEARPAQPRVSSLAPISSRAFRYLFVGTALTMTGHFMQQVAQGWLVYDLTSSPTWLGIVSFLRGIPMLVLALPAGVLVDRFDRRTVLVIGQGLTAVVSVTLAALIWMDAIEPWHIAAAAFLGGCLFVVIVPTRQALVPNTVERSQMGAAIALMSTGQNSGRVLGPALAGVLIAALGVAASFAVQAGGFVLALVMSFMLGPRPSRSSARDSSVIQNLMEGVRYVWGDASVLALMSLQAIPSMLIMPYTQLLPIFARDILHVGPDGLGMLMTANGVGSVLGAVLIVALPARRMGLSLLGALGAFGLLLTAFAASTWLPLSVAIMGLLGMAQAIYLATNTTMVQLTVPDALRGRVMSVYMMTWGLMPLGSLPQGILADWYGAPVVIATTGLLACLMVIVAAMRLPHVRNA